MRACALRPHGLAIALHGADGNEAEHDARQAAEENQMKTMTTALVLMGSLMIASGVAAGSAGQTAQSTKIEMLASGPIQSGQATAQFRVQPPAQTGYTHLAQLSMSGALLDQRTIAFGSSAILAGQVTADGQPHWLLVSVYRVSPLGVRVLVAQQAFVVKLAP
jgi:hypothetical protein